MKKVVITKSAYKIAFNPVVRDFLAVSYHDGLVRIYQLSHGLSQPKKDVQKAKK